MSYIRKTMASPHHCSDSMAADELQKFLLQPLRPPTWLLVSHSRDRRIRKTIRAGKFAEILHCPPSHNL